MKIAVIGYGRMGHEIEKIAQKRGHEICAVFDVDKVFSAGSDVKGAQAAIDFSLAQSVLGNLKSAAKLHLPVIEGTTGWDAQFAEASAIQHLTMLYSPNFSLGVYQLCKLVEQAAKLLGPLKEYDCYVHEWHHRGKADSPSGTAKKLAKILVDNLPDKEKILAQTSEGKIAPQALHVTSTRIGRIPGTHEIGFDSAYDLITLRHEAHGREGFAYGAVRAAEWIVGKTGILTMDDFVHSLF